MLGISIQFHLMLLVHLMLYLSIELKFYDRIEFSSQ